MIASPDGSIDYGVIDALEYTYPSGSSQVSKITDGSIGYLGFKNNQADYGYSSSGNMVSATNKADGIAYSWHDMPLEFSSPKGNLKNYYSANGTKLKTVVEPAGGGDVSTIHYFSGMEYKNEELHTAYWSEGRANFDASKGGSQHEYYIKDHLGNTRVRFADKVDLITGEADGIITYDPSDPENDEVLSTHQYYPFGMEWDTPNVDSNGNSLRPTDGETRYTYNGKEFIDDLDIDLNDYGARQYDAVIGRWISIDPLAEDYAPLSSYNYVLNNPLIHVDPDGMSVDTFVPAANRPKAWDSNYVEWAQNADSETTMTFTWAERAYLIGSWLGLASPTGRVSSAGKALKGVDEAVDVQKRADEVHSALPAATQSRTTTAVGLTEDGTVLVGSSEKYLRKSQRAVLNEAEVHAIGTGHAEETVLNTAQAMNKNLKEVAASRPVCLDCEKALTSSNVLIKSATSGKVSRTRLSSLRGYSTKKKK